VNSLINQYDFMRIISLAAKVTSRQISLQNFCLTKKVEYSVIASEWLKEMHDFFETGRCKFFAQ